MRRRLIAVGSLILSSIGAAAFALAAVPPQPVKVGLVAPFSGRDAIVGQQLLGAVKLALADREVAIAGRDPAAPSEPGAPDRPMGAGRRDRRPVELVAYDETGPADQMARQAAKLAADPQMIAVLGHPAPASAIVAGPIYRAAGLPAWLIAPDLAPDVAGPPVVAIGPTGPGLSSAIDRFASLTGQGAPLILVDPSVEADALGTVIGRVLDRPEEGPALVRGAGAGAVVYAGPVEPAARLLSGLRIDGWSGPILFVIRPGSPADLLKIAGIPPGESYYLADLAPDEPTPGFDRRFEAATGLQPWPEARRMYAVTARLLTEIDLLQATRGGGFAPLGRSLDRSAVASEAAVPRAERGLYALVPDRFPGPLVAPVKGG